MMNLKEIGMWVVLLLFGAGLIWSDGYDSGKNDLRTEQTGQLNDALKEQEDQRVKYQAKQEAIESEWREKSKVVASSAAVLVDDLRNRNVRLSVKLADLTVSSVKDSNQCRVDGRAELHRETSEFLIGEAQRADAQVKALQGTIKNLQQGGVQ